MRRKRIMIIGAGRSGKTTLANWLNGNYGPAKRTSHMVYGKNTIDVPGAYLQCPWMHCHLIAAAQDAFCVLMLADLGASQDSYPPGFAKVFRVPVLGVMTRGNGDPAQEELCRRKLLRAGVEPPFYTIGPEGKEGLAELNNAITAAEKGGI